MTRIRNCAILLALSALATVTPVSAELEITNVTDVILQDGANEQSLETTTCFTRDAVGGGGKELVCPVDLSAVGLNIIATPVDQVVAVGANATINLQLTSDTFTSDNVSVTDNQGCLLANQIDGLTVVAGQPENDSCIVENVTGDLTVIFTGSGTLQPGGGPTNASDSVSVRINGLNADVTNSPLIVAPGGPASFNVDVTPTDLAAADIAVSDDSGNGFTCTPATQSSTGPGDPVSFSCDLAAVNTDLSGDFRASSPDASDALAAYQVSRNALAVNVSPQSQTINSGATANLTITVTPSGPTADNVVITDDTGNCSANLGNITGATNSNCSITGVTANINANLTVTADDALDGTGSYSVSIQVAGDACLPAGVSFAQLPSYCSEPAHNVCLAASFINRAMSTASPDLAFWNNGQWWNTVIGTPELIPLKRDEYLSLELTPDSAGDNDGRIIRTSPVPTIQGMISISDCPGDFSRRPSGQRPFANDVALDIAGAISVCSVSGVDNAAVPWIIGTAPRLSDCGLLQGSGRYFLNVVNAVSDDGETGWTTDCTQSVCGFDLQQGER